jgi:ATP-dependent helicase HrpB
MKNLPIIQVIPEIKEKLQRHNRVILQAPPGAGKTTALPLALLDEPWLQGKKIIMLEPRRLAVRSSASRMAELLGEKVGERVGYQVKMDVVQSKKTQILIVTEGILTRKLQHDPSLEDVALVIFDEFHERSIHADLSLALCLESQTILREDLKILIMSATLNTLAISKLLDNVPIVQSQGRVFPVERFYLDPTTPVPTKKELPFYLHRRILRLLETEEGNILVFLSGVREIKTVERLLNESRVEGLDVSALYGNLTKEAQDRAIKAPKSGRRKVVLSTNIAQTSLTIEGIKIVVDSGIQNVSLFSPLSGMNKLERQFISQDSATQRAGRAGRLSAGKAYHLWHESKILLQHDTPEILQADLSQLVLDLALWGNESIEEFRWMDTPLPSAIAHAKKLLEQLGALKNGAITSHGEKMSRLPLHPRLSHMMIEAKKLGVSYEASLLAVLLTEKDIYRNAQNLSDIKERVEVLHLVATKQKINAGLVNTKQAHYLLANAKRIEREQKSKINSEMLCVLLAFAYPDRIAQLRHKNRGVYLLSNKKGANLHHEDELFNAKFLVVADLDGKSTNATIYKAIELTLAQIEEYLSDQIETQNIVSWNEEQERVEVRRVEKLGAIVLKEMQINTATSEEIAEVLLEELEELGLDALNWSKEALNLRERINFVNHYGYDFPNFSDEYLLENMDEWLAPYIIGINSLRGLKSLDLYNILLGQLNYEQTQEINRLAPSKLKVASGSNIFLDYSNPQQPILSVRLQEMFGTKSTPTLLHGKVKLMIHLLSPASRPMQVTQDLESFWANTYDEVKKELRGKYKRHYWPDDPLSAVATSRTKKRM